MNALRLELPQVLAQRIADLAGAARPMECCGLIEGIRVGDAFQAMDIHPARNLADRDKFEIAPEDHFAAAKSARANGRHLIGCYHSHPGSPAAPSPADLAGAGQEDFVWLIAGGDEGGWDMAAYLFRQGGFKPVYLVMSSE